MPLMHGPFLFLVEFERIIQIGLSSFYNCKSLNSVHLIGGLHLYV